MRTLQIAPRLLVSICKHLLVPDEELPALLAKTREEHTKENNGPDFDNEADESKDNLREDEVLDGCMRTWDVKDAEEEEAPAEPSPLPAADVKEPVALAPEQELSSLPSACVSFSLSVWPLEKLHRAPALVQNYLQQ